MDGQRLPTLALWQYVFLYSIYQAFVLLMLVGAFALGWNIRAWALDLARANSIMIAIAWLVLYIGYGPSAIATYWEARFLPDKAWARYAVRAADVGIHILPVLVLGAPTSPESYLFAISMMAFWYVVTRPYIMYFLRVAPVRLSDLVLYMLYPLVVCLLAVSPRKGA